MKYTYFDKPKEFLGSVLEFDKHKAQQYFQWFLFIKDKRIKVLEEAVQSSKGFEEWTANYSVNSLKCLQKWFESVVEKRDTTEVEKNTEIKAYKGTQFEESFMDDGPAEWTITDLTESICQDVALFPIQIRHSIKIYTYGSDTSDKNCFSLGII